MNQINKKTTLQFPDVFFKEEIRCDYVVTEKLKKIWAIEIDLLNELVRVCRKHDIKVTLFAGSLLGAVRHKGFIPWDDDLDVCFTRPEFEKLLKVADDEFKYPYFLQTALSDRKLFVGYARLRNSLTTGLIKGYETIKYNNGIYIDVFVLDGFIEDENKLRKQYQKLDFIYRLTGMYRMCFFNSNYLKKIIKGVVFIPLHYTICKLIPYEKVIKWYNDTLQQYNNDTERITLLTHPMELLKKYWCNKNELDNIIWVPFENITVPIPSEYDVMLTHIYGNYMEFPPVEQRGKWHEGIIKFDPDTPYVDYIKQKKYKK